MFEMSDAGDKARFAAVRINKGWTETLCSFIANATCPLAAFEREQYHGLVYRCQRSMLKVLHARGIPKGERFEVFVPGDYRSIAAPFAADQVRIICDPALVIENGTDSRAMMAECEDEQDLDEPSNLDYTPMFSGDGYVVVPCRVHSTAFMRVIDIDDYGKLG